ncbi:MAG TPA: hypothetical protein PKZ32_11190 [Candidatus Melainabacteria bacterium]|nr:hypothetical protein [Candidatus Melainabacteria bacterium]
MLTFIFTLTVTVILGFAIHLYWRHRIDIYFVPGSGFRTFLVRGMALMLMVVSYLLIASLLPYLAEPFSDLVSNLFGFERSTLYLPILVQLHVLAFAVVLYCTGLVMKKTLSVRSFQSAFVASNLLALLVAAGSTLALAFLN